MVFDGYSVGKHVFSLQWVAIIILVKSFNTYLDAFGNFRYHTIKCESSAKAENTAS